jgi:hypothetical protein
MKNSVEEIRSGMMHNKNYENIAEKAMNTGLSYFLEASLPAIASSHGYLLQ